MPRVYEGNIILYDLGVSTMPAVTVVIILQTFLLL